MSDKVFQNNTPSPFHSEETMASIPDPAAARRLNVLAQQLATADPTPQRSTIERQPTSATAASTSYASIDGRPSSYARVHGDVSRAPAAWRRIPVVAKEQLQEVLYDKAEGIAKVGYVHQGSCQPESTCKSANNEALFTFADHHQPPTQAQCIHTTHRYVQLCGR